MLNDKNMESIKYDNALREFDNGDIVKGKVIEIRDNDVFIDIGYKSEGVINLKEFEDESGDININIGDEVEVLFLNRIDQFGFEKLSKSAADKLKGWKKLYEAYKNNKPIKGEIKNLVTGGFSVDIGGFTAFLPGSQVELHPIRNYKSYVGKIFEFKILNINEHRKNAIISRKALLEELKMHKLQELEKKIQKDTILTGIVKNITDYGIFVDLDGMDGLVHITDMSWSRINHPSDMVKIGDIVNVKVINIEEKNGQKKIYLGMKQLVKNPWLSIETKFKIGDIIEGKLVNIVDYGFFVEIAEGIEGLVHKSEISYDIDPSEYIKSYKIGDVLKVKILNIEASNRRISLSVKQAKEDPWTTVDKNYSVGSIVEGKVSSIKDFGVFVKLQEGIEGLIHKNDISWDKDEKININVHDNINAVILTIDPEKRKVALGLKQLTQDPWEDIDKNYKIGDVIEVKVVSVKNFGAFVKVKSGVESLIPRSEFNNYNPKLDETLTARILKLDKVKKKFICQIYK